MRKFKSIPALREFLDHERKKGRKISFVPTMGALHDGHKSCVDIARKNGDVLVVSIFVNPTQFGPSEDFDSYPRRNEQDLRLLERWGCDAAFLPSASDMYEAEHLVWVDVERITDVLCGKSRPGHFRGVCTVVAKLFNIVEPDVAVFGQKDAQQALVIRKMAKQLNFPVDIVLSPIVREPDGLAVSSRNEYLSQEERTRAAGIFKALSYGRLLLEKGERSTAVILRAVTERIKEAGIEEIEYVQLLRANDLTQVDPVEGRILIAVAARVGETRLIDNLVLDVRDEVREGMLF